MSSGMAPEHLSVPEAVADLFPSAAERLRFEDWLTRELLGAASRLRAGPVTPTLDMEAFGRELGEFDFARPVPFEPLLRWTIERLEHGIVQMGNPRYFGLFNPGPTFAAQCADRIVAAFNPQLASSASSPVPVALEHHLIRSFGIRAGLPRELACGHFATGGSEANYTALLSALTRAHPGFSQHGVRAFPGPVAFYTSRECHIAWLKIAHQAGVGRGALRLVATDGCGRLDTAALASMIAADRAAGTIPVMVVATAGTTGGGMIDPLNDCADIATRENLWYHVDAAWGGAALASRRLRPLLDGIGRADSITIDAHKWMATTMGCAMFLSRHGPLLSEVFHCSTSFMPSSLAGSDPYLNSVQWSRRFMGLRLFLELATAGWDGLGAHVERSCAVIGQVRRRLVATGWAIANDSQLAVLDAVPPSSAGDVRALVRRVVASGRAWVAPVQFEGRDAVRICATNGETGPADIEALVAVLNGAD